jgi:hypothetical protein
VVEQRNGKKTALVEDITPGPLSSNLSNFCSVSKKLFFVKDLYTNNASLWVSGRVHANDPNHDDTHEVDNPVVNGLTAFSNLTAAGNTLFFSAYNYKYGYELYAGNITNKGFVVKNSMEKADAMAETSTAFAISVSPNPAQATAVLLLKGVTQPVSVQIADMTGRIVWQQKAGNYTLVPLPVQTLSPGVYIISAKQGTQMKMVQFVRK